MSSAGKTKQVLVSVGTYTFNPLLERMDSPAMIEVLKKHGFNRLVFQCGRTYQIKNAPGLIETEVFGLTPKYDEYVENSSLLIGHCGRISSPGAGTILDCIKTGTPAIIVSNEGMMHNHQLELLDALIEENAIIGFKESGVVNPTSMDEAITKIEKKVVKPLNIPKDNNIFKHILDEGRYD